MKGLSTYIFLFLFSGFVYGQTSEERLAISYSQEGDCEKASVLFQKLKKSKTLTSNAFEYAVGCWESEKNYNQLIDLCNYFYIKTRKLEFKVYEIAYLERSNERKKAQRLKETLVKNTFNNVNKSKQLASHFRRQGYYMEAIELLNKNESYIGQKGFHALDISYLYYLKGDKQESVNQLLDYSKVSSSSYNNVMKVLPNYLQDDNDYTILKKELIKRIRTEKFGLRYEQMLSWVFVQQKDWNSAFLHYKAISKKKDDQGRKVLELAKLCTSNEEYDLAAKCYRYVWQLGKNNMFYQMAQSGWLSSRYNSVVKKPYPDTISLQRLDKDFLEFINSGERSPYVAQAMRQLAEVYIKYMRRSSEAVSLLEKAISFPSASDKFKSECKLDLGDAYLFLGDVWESELLYAQVQKAYNEEELGQEARFKKAQLAYYRGEFTWSETQLEVLKGATSQLISNNAIELALRIQDNLGIDSNYVVMETYANAELLLYQNRSNEALKEVEKITLLFPEHSLADEVLYLKARVYAQKQEWDKSISNYKELITMHKEDILYDNGLFELASIYEEQFKDTSNAMLYYEELILNQKGSLYVVEASRRYRALRGDVIKEAENYYFKP